jgi:hypothetical protein
MHKKQGCFQDQTSQLFADNRHRLAMLKHSGYEVGFLMVRRLEPHFVNLGKRLVKSPITLNKIKP